MLVSSFKLFTSLHDTSIINIICWFSAIMKNLCNFVKQDKYILGCMTVLCCICIWHAVATVVNLYFPTHVIWADKVALTILSSLYIGLHLIFFFTASCLVSYPNLYSCIMFQLFKCSIIEHYYSSTAKCNYR